MDQGDETPLVGTFGPWKCYCGGLCCANNNESKLSERPGLGVREVVKLIRESVKVASISNYDIETSNFLQLRNSTKII